MNHHSDEMTAEERLVRLAAQPHSPAELEMAMREFEQVALMHEQIAAFLLEN